MVSISINGVDWEFVKASGKREAYFRRKPDRLNPSPQQKKVRLKFTKAAYDSFGENQRDKLTPACYAVEEVFEDYEPEVKEEIEDLIYLLSKPPIKPDVEELKELLLQM